MKICDLTRCFVVEPFVVDGLVAVAQLGGHVGGLKVI